MQSSNRFLPALALFGAVAMAVGCAREAGPPVPKPEKPTEEQLSKLTPDQRAHVEKFFQQQKDFEARGSGR